MGGRTSGATARGSGSGGRPGRSSSNGAQVRLDNAGIGNEPLTLNSFLDYSPTGGLLNLAGNNTWGAGATAITVGNSFTGVDANPGTTLTLNGTVGGTAARVQLSDSQIAAGTSALAGGALDLTGHGTTVADLTLNAATVPARRHRGGRREPRRPDRSRPLAARVEHRRRRGRDRPDAWRRLGGHAHGPDRRHRPHPGWRHRDVHRGTHG